MRQLIVIAALCTVVAGPLAAQDRAETLADIRQDLTVLYVELQRLKQKHLARRSSRAEIPIGLSTDHLIERISHCSPSRNFLFVLWTT